MTETHFWIIYTVSLLLWIALILMMLYNGDIINGGSWWPVSHRNYSSNQYAVLVRCGGIHTRCKPPAKTCR